VRVLELAGQAAQTFTAPGNHDQVAAACGECPAVSLADSGRGAGDQCTPPGEALPRRRGAHVAPDEDGAVPSR
jgi:hypothetical protein